MATWTAWPPRMVLHIYQEDGTIIFRSHSKKFDLCDETFRGWKRADRNIIIGISTKSAKWLSWKDLEIDKIENNIRYEYNNDGFIVKIERLFENGLSCRAEAKWKCKVIVDYGKPSRLD